MEPVFGEGWDAGGEEWFDFLMEERGISLPAHGQRHFSRFFSHFFSNFFSSFQHSVLMVIHSLTNGNEEISLKAQGREL